MILQSAAGTVKGRALICAFPFDRFIVTHLLHAVNDEKKIGGISKNIWFFLENLYVLTNKDRLPILIRLDSRTISMMATRFQKEIRQIHRPAVVLIGCKTDPT